MIRNLTVRHGDTIIPVTVDSDDDMDGVAIQAAASARESMNAQRYHVYNEDDGLVGSFSTSEIDDWWA